MHSSRSLLAIRYGLGGGMILAGTVLLFVSPIGFGTDAFALGVGGGLSVLLLNFLYRLGVSGDRDRDREEEARQFLELHGYWPDEAPEDARESLLHRLGDALKLEDEATSARRP